MENYKYLNKCNEGASKVSGNTMQIDNKAGNLHYLCIVSESQGIMSGQSAVTWLQRSLWDSCWCRLPLYNHVLDQMSVTLSLTCALRIPASRDAHQTGTSATFLTQARLKRWIGLNASSSLRPRQYRNPPLLFVTEAIFSFTAQAQKHAGHIQMLQCNVGSIHIEWDGELNHHAAEQWRFG